MSASASTSTPPGYPGRLPPDPLAAAASAPSSAATLPSSHPISQRLRSTLVQPSDNEAAINSALDTLAALYSTSRPPSVQVRHATDRPETSRPPVPVDTHRARRNVERDARNRTLKATDQFIAVLQTVDDSLSQLGLHVQGMHASCDEVQAKLQKAAQSSRFLIEHAEGLQRQREAIQLHKQLSALFLQRFTLSDDEKEAIHSRQVRVGSRLFAAMDHLERIRSECRVLLEGSDTNGLGGGTAAGIDIMRSTSDDLELAYQKIFKWCSFEFRQPVKEGLEVSRHLREAVTRLIKARQDLLRSALSTLVTTRSSILANSFITALTVGGPAPTFLPRPIELHAHDPLRYIGDMLAWIHQTLASEREFLTALFGEKEGEGGRRTGQRRRGLEGSVDLTGSDPEAKMLGPGEALVREVLNRNLEGCCRPLKIRVQQTVRSQEGSVTTYRLAHLVQFYRLTMEKTVGSRAALSQTLKEIADISLEAFFVTLDRQAAGLSRFEEPPDQTLSPPLPLVGVSSTLKELLAEYQRSLADGDIVQRPATTHDGAPADPLDEQKEAPSTDADAAAKPPSLDDFHLVLVRLVDPMLDMCRKMTDVAVRNRPRAKSEEAAGWEASIFLLNCLGYMVNLLQVYSFTATKVEQLKLSTHDETEKLANKHYLELLEDSGLQPIVQAIDTKDPDMPLSHHPPTTPTQLTRYLNTFHDFLSSSEVISPSRLARLQSPPLRAEIHQSALRKLTEAYGRVVEAVRTPTNKYEWRETLVRRSREEVEILLGLSSEA